MDPLPKPRRRRKWLRWLAVPAAAAILALLYYLTRPPELVWWRSPALDQAGHFAKVLIRRGWENDQMFADANTNEFHILASFKWSDKRPMLIRKIIPLPEVTGSM